MDIWTSLQLDHMTTSPVALPFKAFLRAKQPSTSPLALLHRLPDGESRWEAGKANPNPRVQVWSFAYPAGRSRAEPHRHP